MTSKGFFYLSPREKLLLRRFAHGKTDATIATELGDRESRISAQRKRLLKKLEIGSDEQLLIVANRVASWPAQVRRQNSGQRAEADHADFETPRSS